MERFFAPLKLGALQLKHRVSVSAVAKSADPRLGKIRL